MVIECKNYNDIPITLIFGYKVEECDLFVQFLPRKIIKPDNSCRIYYVDIGLDNSCIFQITQYWNKFINTSIDDYNIKKSFEFGKSIIENILELEKVKYSMEDGSVEFHEVVYGIYNNDTKQIARISSMDQVFGPLERDIHTLYVDDITNSLIPSFYIYDPYEDNFKPIKLQYNIDIVIKEETE